MVNKISTKDLIAQSLFELLGKSQIQDISVRDICSNCGLNTRTFYLHFEDKHDAVNYIYKNLTTECWYGVGGRKNSLGMFFSAIANKAYGEYRQFYKNVLSYHGQNNLREYIRTNGIEELERLMEWNGYKHAISKKTRECLSFYMLGLTGWVERTLFVPASQMEKFDVYTALNCLPDEISKYLTADPNNNSNANALSTSE